MTLKEAIDMTLGEPDSKTIQNNINSIQAIQNNKSLSQEELRKLEAIKTTMKQQKDLQDKKEKEKQQPQGQEQSTAQLDLNTNTAQVETIK